MSDNPFASPPPVDAPNPSLSPTVNASYAGRGLRFAGAFLDGIILAIVNIPAIFGLVFLMGFDLTTMDQLTLNPIYLGGGFIIGQIIFLVVQGYLLATRGQTIGKLVCKTRIVTTGTMDTPDFWPMYLKRYFLPGILYNIPMVGGLIALVNALLIFRPNYRCLHDDLANTSVIAAQ